MLSSRQPTRRSIALFHRKIFLAIATSPSYRVDTEIVFPQPEIPGILRFGETRRSLRARCHNASLPLDWILISGDEPKEWSGSSCDPALTRLGKLR